MSALDDYMDAQEQEHIKRTRLTSSLGAAASVNPDEYANTVKLAKAAAISVEALPHYREEAQQAKLFGEVGLATMWKDAPKTAEFYSHPDNAKLSSDDHANLTGFEQAAKTLKNYGGAIGEGFIGQGVGTLFSGAGRLYDITARQLAKPIIAIGGDKAKDFLEAPISPYLDPSRMLLKNPGEAFKAFGKSMAPGESDRSFGTDVAGGLGQLGGQALVQYLSGGTVSALSLMAQGTDIVGEKVAKDNASQDAKDSAMLGGGLITSITEKYALDKILGPLAVPVKNVIAASLARIGIAAAAEGGQEIAENIGHDALRKLLTNQDAKIDLPGAAYEGGVGATVGGIARGVIEAALHVRVRGAQREQEAQQAGQMGELLTGMTKLAEASKLRERDVETAQGFFQSVLDEGRDSVFITPEALAQSGLADQIAQAIPAVAEQIQTASETGHDIRLPIAELMATMAGPELAQSIIPHVAVDPGGFTPTTAQEYMQSDKAAELQAEVEKILGEKQVDDTFKASAEIVKSRIISELTATTRWDSAKNEADATIYSAYYAVRAAQLGVTPEALYDQRRVNFSDTMIAGDQFDQGTDWKDDRFSYNGWTYFRPGAEVKQTAYPGQPAKVVEVREGRNGEDTLYKIEIDVRGHPEGVDENGDPVDKKYSTVRADELNRINPAVDNVLNQSAKSKEISELVAQAKAPGHANATVSIGAVPAWEVEAAKNAGFDISGYTHTADLYAIRHAIKQHGNQAKEEKRNQLALTDADFAALPSALMAPDQIILGTKNERGQDQVFSVKQLGDGTLLVVEEVRTGKRVLAVQSMRKIPGAKNAKELLPSVLLNAQDGAGVNPIVVNRPGEYNQSAYHGTPYQFDKFSLEHMGKGEGAQAYGWGLYFAGDKSVAEWYRNSLTDSWSGPPRRYFKGDELTPGTPEYHVATFLSRNGETVASARKAFAEWIKDAEKEPGSEGRSDVIGWKQSLELLKAVKSKKEFSEKPYLGQLYEADIPEHDQYLDWDNPLSEQPEKLDKIRQLILSDAVEQRALDDFDVETREQLADKVIAPAEQDDGEGFKHVTGENIYGSLTDIFRTDEAASKALNSVGIPGIRYLDGNSRSASKGKHNYVVFDDKAVKVLQTFYQTNETNLGKFSPDKLTVTMLQGANFSTTLHEGAHFFFENDIYLASKILADANIHGYDTLSVGEKQILLDVSKLMDWHGIQGDITEQLRQWSNMDFEERRTYHERTAESFERYLFEGKAPSIELQPYFQRFAAWWKNVYNSMQEFLFKNPEAGKLNPEVTAVFDRMLATTEQIQLAEQGRSMMPMFRTQAEANNVGMTPAEFAAYQHQDVDATNEAIQQLQARGLRDMQWIHNARGRMIKKLQRESAAKRAEVQMEARAEIMSQPIYRAWTFLTGRLTADDKVTAPKPPKSDPNVLDETIDSLFVAIAKLGGINKGELVTTWGIDPADKASSGVFGKNVMRAKDKGLSIDGMAEALSQYGYLEQDENGKWDIRELEEKFKAELGGDTQFSNAYDYASNQAPGKAGEEVINPDAVQAGRLARGSLEEMGLPIELINHLVALKMVAKEGWHPDLLADKFAFESGDDMVRRIAAAESPKDAINGLTDQRMLERFGDLSSQEAIDKAADKAIHNEVRARMMATELNALENALGKRKTLASAAKEYAGAMIGRVKVRDLKPGQYASAEARALKAAQAASKSGDIAKAAAEQRNALINNYATRAAHDAQDSIEKLRRDMASLANRSDDKLKKSYDMDLVNAVRAILGEYGIAEKKAKRAVDYLEVFKQNDPDMFAVVSDAVANASRNAKPYKDLTVDDARALGEEVAAILHLAKRSRQMEVDGDMIDRQEIEDALHARLVALGVPESMPGDASAITKGEVAMQKFRSAIASLTRVESWVGKMDGADTYGPFRRFIFGRVKNAADAYRSDKSKYLKQFGDLFESIRPTLKPAIIAAPELGYTFGKDAGGSGINEIVHAILHTGNASNKRKLLLGRGWATERPDGSLDTSRWNAFIQRMANEGKITKAHFDFAQGVWDLLESTKPLAQKTHRDVFGKYFDEVTAEPLNSPFGVYAGGYVPAMADSRIVADAKMRALSEAENQSMKFSFPTTAKGFTKGRVEYNAPLMLDLRTLSQHIDKVLMFSHMEMPVRDVQRVLAGVGGTLNKVDPEAALSMIKPWLNRAAKQQVVTPISDDAGFSRFCSVMRSRAGAAAMFGNLANAVQQVTGFSLAALKVRPSLMLSAAADYAKHPRAFVAGVSEASLYMAERLNSEVAAMNDNINDILLNPTLLEKGQAWSMRHAYFLQTAIDSAMSPIVWTAAYNQALEQGHSHDDAVRLGDSAVRETQGSSLPEDISRFEGGEAWLRLFTQFAGYFNMQANLLGTEYAKMIQQDYGLRKNASKGLFIFMLGYYAPAVVGELVMQLFKGGPGDDDKDGEYLDDWLAVLFGWAPLRTAAAMVPLAGQGVMGIVNATNSKPYDDRLATSPAISMLESSIRSVPSVYNAVINDGSGQKAVRDVATLISMTVGIPVNLAARPIGYAVGVADNKITPTSGPDMARGLVTGIASPDSKR